ncbi:MAG: flagellar hook-basal body complex protein [Deltaproteobacteria bacterium]|jgi:flagellar hook protein FlgE|nr:flagellar hook-basal body complex protein [Deltaproteobacteria bacterium]
MMSSLYIGATGMHTHSRGMQVVGNNLANVSTVGFKQSSALYQDLFNSLVMSPSNNVTNISQLGHGSNFVASRTLFSMGGLESSNTVTDMAINGVGFFGVIKNDQILYTKAGNMRFDLEGNLLDPTGYNLLGHKINEDGVVSASFEPIKINLSAGAPDSTYPARPTSSVNLTSHLGGMENKSEDPANPVFAMTSAWNGLHNPPLNMDLAGYMDALTVYDAAGDPQELRVYYDYVGMHNGMKLYEYTVGINPDLDGSSRAESLAAGLLLSGTLSFASNGDIIGMTAYTPPGEPPYGPERWSPAPLQNGSPALQVNFAGAGAQNITLDFGLKLNQGYDPALISPTTGAVNPNLFYAAAAGAEKSDNSSSSRGTSPYNYFSRQDGVPEGYLRNLDINDEGYVTARYSNGEARDLYRIGLFRFVSQDGLRHEGANHFAATDASGPADEGMPGTENFGTLSSYHLETSNVDMAREFTHMIITQRGFQANSKIITTSDAMLQRALELKR